MFDLDFNLFSLFQSAGRDGRTSLAAKGLTGEGYDGHYFWDTEIFALPFFTYTQPEIARALLCYRSGRLDQARARAAELGQRGALYPWRTIGGEEASAYTKHRLTVGRKASLALLQSIELQGIIAVGVQRDSEVEDPSLADLLPLLAAMKVDLKAFREGFYRDVVRGELKPVLKAIETIRASKTWLEIVVLLIPTLNDSEEEVREFDQRVKRLLGLKKGDEIEYTVEPKYDGLAVELTYTGGLLERASTRGDGCSPSRTWGCCPRTSPSCAPSSPGPRGWCW